MSYGISAPTYYGLQNVTELRTIKPSFTQSFGRAGDRYTTSFTLPNGLTYENTFFHWSGVLNVDLLRWVSSTTLSLTISAGVGSITLTFRGM